MKNKKIQVLIYILLIVVAIIILVFALPKLFSNKKADKAGEKPAEQKYKIVKQSKSDKIIYDYKKFKTEFIKVGFEETSCNDDVISGLDPIICHAKRNIFVEKEIDDILSLTFNGEVVETMSVNLKYDGDDFKTKTLVKDANNIVNNLIDYKVDDAIIKDLLEKITKTPTELGVSTHKDSKDYRVFYNMKFVEGNEINPRYFDLSIIFYQKSTIIDLETPVTEAEKEMESSKSIMER